MHNEEETDLRRTQTYILSAVYNADLLSAARLFAIAVIGRLSGWKRYDRDTYLEMDITDLPPGEVIQIGWNGKKTQVPYRGKIKKYSVKRDGFI